MQNNKIHILCFVVITFYCIIKLKAQPFGNEWINPSQVYYKIPITETGLYRITRNDFIKNKIPIDDYPPNYLQLFARGEEQYIYIKTNLGLVEYIEFYAQKNDGFLDKYLYDSPNSQVNPYYSLITDTAWYYLTWTSGNHRRITEVSYDNYSSYTPSENCYKQTLVNYTSAYYLADVLNPQYTVGEGWFDYPCFGYGNCYPLEKSIPLPGLYKNSLLNAEIEFAIGGQPASNSAHHYPKVTVQGTDTNFYTHYIGYNYCRKTLYIPSSQLNTPTKLTFSSVAAEYGLSVDRNVVSYIKIKYPATYNFGGTSYSEFFLNANANDKTYTYFTNFSGGIEPVLYNITNYKKIKVTSINYDYRALIPNDSSEMLCVLSSVSSLKSVTGFKKVFGLTNFATKQTNYIIITHPSLNYEVLQYKTLLHPNAIIVNIEELYDQFSYGIQKHPMAIKNFINYCLTTWTIKPEYLFLIGKSIHAKDYRNNNTYYNKCLVPSLGSPASDILLTSELNGAVFEPSVATGRLAAQTPNDVSIYRNKVYDYIKNEPEKWMKNILHFGGGKSIAENTLFLSYLNTYKTIIEDTLFGAKVSTFVKNSSNPIQITISDSVRNIIENGCSIMTFFGHGSTTGFDQSIENINSYNNKGKYPLVIANSCYSGDIHLPPPSTSVSEDWIFVANKGVIGFIASVDVGYAEYLHGFSSNLYKNIAYRFYGKPIGKCLQEAIKYYQIGNYGNYFVSNTCYGMNLHGDPGLVINSFTKPDFSISANNISFLPNDITAKDDSFSVAITVNNIGMATLKPFKIDVIRYYPDNTFSHIETTMNGCLYKNTVTVKFPVDIIKGNGLNKIKIFLDANYEVEELNELNNEISSELFIKSQHVTPIHPYEYAIFPYNTVELKASTNFAFLPTTTFVFQIDTTDLFNSPLKKQGKVTQSGGIIRWLVPFNLTDSTVYFWRVSIDSTETQNYSWSQSSFMFIKKKEGWTQAHHFQFNNNNYNMINYIRAPRKFEFMVTPKQLHCSTKGPPINYLNIRYDIDGYGGDVANSCGYNNEAMIIVVIDSLSLNPWESNRDNFGHCNYPSGRSYRNDFYFIFKTNDSIQRAAMANFINAIPNGNYILAYTYISGNFKKWEESVYHAFELLGADSVRYIPNNYPYIFCTKKGNTLSSVEIIGDTVSSEINLTYNLLTNNTYGTITSTKVGPAKIWKSLHWKQEAIESINDSVTLSVFAIDHQGNESMILHNIPSDSIDIYDLNNRIDANIFPYLKLQLYTQDNKYKTPSQLKRWLITYEGVPETALNAALGYYFPNDTVQEGENIVLSIATQNISTYNMDSLLIKYWVQDKNNRITQTIYKRLRPHKAGDILRDTISITTLGLTGLNKLWVEVNPINPNTNKYDQPEQYHFNNIAQLFFVVTSDNKNPLLDVTFDGIHILNGDIISPKPEILIKLNDENKYLALADTSLFTIYLKKPSDNEEKLIPFTDNYGRTLLHFYPAQLPKNTCKILYYPEFTEDGIYTLRIQAKDRSNNESGDNDYIISFEVVTKSSITEVINYPNPFSTSTRFVFMLTGSEIPNDFRIQIMTITGKVVKVITKQELGSIRIGRNISEYAWDGTDTYGNKLANGVYFYKVIATINGGEIEKKQNESQRFFEHGLGKIYIMR